MKKHRRDEDVPRLREALTACHLACADAIRAIDALDDDGQPEDRGIAPFGFDNDHL